MERNGRASDKWGRYVGDSLVIRPNKNRIRLVTAPKSKERPDPMCDYIEGAEWWLAISEYSQRKIYSLFEQQEVACCLYERVGAIVEVGRIGKKYLLGIQLVRLGRGQDWDIDISLSDIGIYLEEQWEANGANEHESEDLEGEEEAELEAEGVPSRA